VAGLALLGACQRAPEAGQASSTPEPNTLELVFTYGSEKQDWVEAATKAFNARREKTAAGHVIRVKPMAMGSGECIDTLLSGEIKAHVTSPASAAFIKLGNAQSRVKTGHDLVGATENLVLSPVVIAMWQPMAEALGWGQRPIGWAEILKIAQDPRGWASLGHPEWGEIPLRPHEPRA
jgi:Ca-activated chloride channel family protein